MKKLRNNKKGFTLIELIVVVAILAILAAVAVPNFVGMTERAETATEVAAAAEIANAINIYNAMNPSSAITGTGGHPVAADITTLGNLAPKTDIANPGTVIYPRVTIADGIATVTVKTNL